MLKEVPFVAVPNYPLPLSSPRRRGSIFSSFVSLRALCGEK